MDINKIIFSRTAAQKKKQIVQDLSANELLSITTDTIIRIVKETGSRISKSRDKMLRISERVGNNWNSDMESLYLSKGKLSVSFYLQYENTDTSTITSFNTFLCKGEYLGSVVRGDRYGNDRHYYFTYTESDKARCLRAILLEYLNKKYKQV